MSTGVVTDITTDWRGDTLSAATLTTTTALPVSTVVDFDEDGGWLVVGDSAPMRYLSVSETASTVTLSAAVGAVYDAGTPVNVWDPSVAGGGAQVVEYVATVELHDGSGSPDAVIPHSLIPLSGVDYLIGATVRVEQNTAGELYVIEVMGREASVDVDKILAPYLTAWLPADVSIPNATMTTVSWGNNVRNAKVVSTSAGSYITVPRNGIYVVTAAAAFAPNSTGFRYVQIVVANPDGTGERVERMVAIPAEGGGTAVVQAVKTLPLLTGERLIVRVQQNSGAALNLLGRLDLTAVELAWVAAR